MNENITLTDDQTIAFNNLGRFTTVQDLVDFYLSTGVDQIIAERAKTFYDAFQSAPDNVKVEVSKSLQVDVVDNAIDVSQVSDIINPINQK